MENQVFESANLFEVSKQSFVTVGGISRNCMRLINRIEKKIHHMILFLVIAVVLYIQ